MPSADRPPLARDECIHLKGCVLVLALVFVVCQLTEVGRFRSLRADETFYIQAAYTMNQSGDWLTPRYEHGDLRFEKPILTYWLVAAPMRFFGVALSIARLPSVLITLATIPFVFGLARALLKDRRVAWLSVAVHLGVKGVYSNAHQARTDALLAFFVVAAMCGFARLLFDEGGGRRDVLLAQAATAGAILTKGLAAVIFIFVPLTLFLALYWKRLPPARRRAALAPWGFGLLLLLVLPWYGYTLVRHGDTFLRSFVHDQVTANIGDKKSVFFLSSAAEYPFLFIRDSLPWSGVVLAVVLVRFRALRAAWHERPLEWLFLLMWVGVAVVIFACGSYTRGRYLLPLLCAVSILAGFALARWGTEAWMGRLLRWGMYILAAMAALTALGVALTLKGWLVATADPALAVAALLVLAASLAIVLFARRLGLNAAIACIGGMTLAISACLSALLTLPFPLELTERLAQSVVMKQAASVQIAVVGAPKGMGAGLLLYAGRRPAASCPYDKPPEQARFVQAFLAKPGARLVIADERVYGALPAEVRAGLRILASERGIAGIGLEKGFLDGLTARLPGLLGERLTLHALYREEGVETAP